MAGSIAAASNQAVVSPAEAPTKTVSERSLSEFLANARADTMSSHATTALANPAALSGEMLKRLQGFIERSASFDKMGKGKLTMDQKDIQLASLTEQAPQQETVHSGPARESLLPAERTRERHDAAVTMDELHRLSDMMNKMMGFGVEIHFVSTAVTNVTGSVRALTRGQ